MTSIDDVLQRVARGELTPDEALSLLDTEGARPAAEPEEEPDGEDDGTGVVFAKAPPPPPEPPPYEPPAEQVPDGPAAGGLRRIKVRTLAGALEVYADPSVAEVLVTRGSPSLRRDGDTLEVAHALAKPVAGSYRFLTRTLAHVPGVDERIVLRVNPAILLDIDASATSLKLWGCEGGLHLRLAASSAKLDRATGPLVVDAQASSVKGSVRLTGTGRIRAESSSVKLSLLDGTDTVITATNRMGKVVLPPGGRRPGEARMTATVGRGTGRLVIDATMSSVMLGRL